MKRRTIDQKIALARIEPVLAVTRDNKSYVFYDETRSESQAGTWAEQLRRRDYDTYIDPRLVDDIMHGRWWTVYDVYFAKTKEDQP